MRHDLHYTLEEARALLPWVQERIATMRSARERLTDTEVRQALTDHAPANGGGQPGKQVGEAFLELRGAVAQLAAAEVVMRDLDRGLIDFPSIRDGEEVYLCWIDGEDDIGFWHGLDAGFAGRQEL